MKRLLIERPATIRIELLYWYDQGEDVQSSGDPAVDGILQGIEN